jgi:hypothetical protein
MGRFSGLIGFGLSIRSATSSNATAPMEFYVGTTQVSTADLTSYTFTAAPYGGDATDGLVACLVTWGTSAGQLTPAVTIGGVAATVVAVNQTLGGAAIAYATGVTGTTGDIVVASQSGLYRRLVVTPIVLFPRSTTPLDQVTNTAGTGVSISASNVEVKNGGLLLF